MCQCRWVSEFCPLVSAGHPVSRIQASGASVSMVRWMSACSAARGNEIDAEVTPSMSRNYGEYSTRTGSTNRRVNASTFRWHPGQSVMRSSSALDPPAITGTM